MDEDVRLDDVADKLQWLAERQESMVQGLDAMVSTLAIHTEILTKILDAATVEPEGSGLADALVRIADAMDAQTESLGALERSFAALPDQIAVAAARA